jgi:hypothetical protein
VEWPGFSTKLRLAQCPAQRDERLPALPEGLSITAQANQHLNSAYLAISHRRGDTCKRERLGALLYDRKLLLFRMVL